MMYGPIACYTAFVSNSGLDVSATLMGARSPYCRMLSQNIVCTISMNSTSFRHGQL